MKSEEDSHFKHRASSSKNRISYPFTAGLPLQFILNVPFAFIFVVSAGLIGFLGFQNGVNSAYDLTHQLIGETSERVQDQLESYFAIPQLLINHNLSAIRLNQLDLSNPSDLQMQFLAQLQSNPNIKGIAYGSEQRAFVATFRSFLGAEFVFAESSEETGYTLSGYAATSEGERGDVLYTRLDTDMRPRIWYQSAVNARQSTWTPIYTMVDQLGIAVDLVSPVYAENNELLGVLDVSLDPSFISEFLREVFEGEASQIFIIDEEGLVVASSTLVEPFETVNGQLQRFNAENANEPLLQSASQRIIEVFGDWSNIANNQQFDFEVHGERQLAQVTLYQLGDLNWWIVVSKPEAAYMVSINQHIQTTVILITILLILSVILMSLVSRWLTKPVMQLSQIAKSFASGNWSERIQIHRSDEIGQLATAFNQMAVELEKSIAMLQGSELRLRAVFDNSADAILVALNGIQLTANPACLSMFGYENTYNIVGKSFLELLVPSEHARISEYVRRRSRGEEAPKTYETLGIRADGSQFDMEVRVSTYYQNGTLYTIAILRDISQRKQVEVALVDSAQLLKQQKYELTERVKELNCLYQHAKLLEQQNISIEELAQETVNLIPPAWQYPDVTCARVILEGSPFTSKNFGVTEWKQSSPIFIDQIESGQLEVYYLVEQASSYEGTFLQEERLLLDELARRLGDKIKALRAEMALKQYYETLEQKVVERTTQLNMAKERVEAILNHSADGILLINPDFTIQQNNTAFDSLFACDANAYLNRHLRDLFSIESEESIETHMAENSNLYITGRALRCDETSFDAELSIGHIKDAGLVCVVRDISIRKETEATLRQTLVKEKELGELKTRFVSMASHEFRTPLASILALSETLEAYRHKMDDADIDECLGQIKGQVGHLKNIMEEVLLLARMQARRQEFNPSKQNINAILKSIVYEFQNRADIAHHLDFTTSQENYEVFVDAKLIRQVLSNLISNAIKYSPADKVIEIRLDASPDAFMLSVQDYGIGIPEDDLKHLFEPFHRASNVGIIQGTGLGLVITKESVELHGGTITVESQLNSGTTILVRIPVQARGENFNDKDTSDRR